MEKKFGPAGGPAGREIGRIVENYEISSKNDQNIDNDSYDDQFSPGRILDTRHGIMERTYDIEARRILLKFHREKGQVKDLLT